MTRSKTVTAVAVLVVLAGCAAPTADAPTEAGIETRGGDLPISIEPGIVFDRVSELMGANVTPPDAIRVRTRGDVNASAGNGSASLAPAFFEVMGVTARESLNATERERLENGATTALGFVSIYTGDNDSRTLHYILAHEFAHYVQFSRGRLATLNRRLDRTTDASFVIGSLLEGAAVYTTDAYLERHVEGSTTNSELYLDLRERLAPGGFGRYANSRYIYGGRYVASRASAPDATDSIYRDPPRTGEQVIHRLAPESEPPRPLSIEVERGGWRQIGADRLGEGFLRVALQHGNPRAEADRAAAGWGNDSLRIYAPRAGGETSYAWVLRFDDAANRSEFLPAVRDSLSARGERRDGAWRIGDRTFALRVVGSETAVLLAGNRTFALDAAASGSNAQVELALPGS